MTETSAQTDTELVLLLRVRCTAIATTDAVAAKVGLSEQEAGDVLAALSERGLVSHRTGAMETWTLTVDGRTRLDELLTAELESAEARPTVEAAYRAFLGHNPHLLAICSDWQLREGNGEQLPNDHTDTAYDAAVLERLRELDAAISGVLDGLTAVLPRFGGYQPGFAAALERLAAGEHQYLTGVRVDSYHTVWFELHEDLLVTLGRSREQESAEESAGS